MNTNNAILVTVIVAYAMGCTTTPHLRTPSTATGAAAAASTGASANAEVHPTAIADSMTSHVLVGSWPEGGDKGILMRTPHYLLRLSLREEPFRDRIPDFMETCFVAYASALGPIAIPEEPLEMYIFGDRTLWEKWTRKKLGRDAEIYIGLGKGGYTTDSVSVLYDIGRFDTQTIAAHEGWHQFSQQTLQHPLPTWMEEGISCYMEGTRLSRDGAPSTFRPWRNFERWSELREAVRADELSSLAELLDGTPQEFLQDGKNSLLTYYAQVWALVQFLRDGESGKYRESFSQLIQDAASGKLAGRLAASKAIIGKKGRERAVQLRTGNAVILEYFNPDFATFSDEYTTFVKAITARGAGDRIFRGEFPLLPAEPPSTASIVAPTVAQPALENKKR
ncbi:MAG: DUF1570 domain-containing protein [Phycisphaerales bacterium]|nr:DUF1570 domain-containing protein [Phycisphaerales bacterium]